MAACGRGSSRRRRIIILLNRGIRLYSRIISFRRASRGGAHRRSPTSMIASIGYSPNTFRSASACGWIGYSSAAWSAARVFLISEFEKEQLARFYGDDSIARCTVVYNPVDWNRYSVGAVSEATRALSEKRFILSVSHQYPHKNTATVVEAFVSIAAKFPDLHLVLVGRGSKAVTEQISAVDDAGVRARISLTGFIRDADLGHLYMNCQAFVLASEYEGFGMPAVEAMGFAVPVIVTNGSSLPEVTMGRGIYVEPNSPVGTWAETIAQQLRASRAHQHLAESAAAVRDRYQPATIAESVMKCVETAAWHA